MRRITDEEGMVLCIFGFARVVILYAMMYYEVSLLFLISGLIAHIGVSACLPPLGISWILQQQTQRGSQSQYPTVSDSQEESHKITYEVLDLY